jgi:eukaryotic-like serine/threonine-protein kinase
MFVPDRVLEHVSEVTDEPDLGGTKYRLVGKIGRGGMSTVYAALDTELGREVAIKVSSAVSASSELCARLRREARVIARLEHPGIVPVHDLGALPDGRFYYVMKLVRGERLDAWAAQTRDRRAVLRLFQRIVEALAFAHARGILHRDLKPENVMVGEFGEALVMDWGIAKELAAAPSRTSGLVDEPAADSAATAAGAVMGTFAYMAPEQARGEVEALGPRTDVYGLGALLYFLLCGHPPFPDGPARAPDAHPRPLRETDPSLAPPLVAVCDKAMALRPTDRYASALDLYDDIRAFLDAEPVSAYRESWVERALRLASRHRVLLSLLGAYLLLRLLLIAFSR